MLPPGHVAAGYLTAYSFVKIVKPALEPYQINQLIFWGTFFGFAPDLDMFWAFAKNKAFILKDLNQTDHRKFFTHAPALWLTTGLLIYFLSLSELIKCLGLLLWLGSWSHFVLDSVECGIMWLWPFSSRMFAFKDVGKRQNIGETKFFQYWWKTVLLYVRSVSFYLEVVLILIALIFYFRF